MPSTDIDGSPIVILSKREIEILVDLIPWWESMPLFGEEEKVLYRKLNKFIGENNE